MTPLGLRIAELIARSGPIPVCEYMALCLYDASDGYYTGREPFGRGGDFTTAPEISQMFGELVAVWLYSAWQASGAPVPFALVEIGPGRGTLMKDMLRTLARLDPGFLGQARVAMVEASPRLAAVQRATLAASGAAVEWHASLETMSGLPSFVVGNELFDALPVRQFVRAGGAWRERCVGLGDDGRLLFGLGAAVLDPSVLPAGADAAPDGAIFEWAPAREAMMDAIARRISACGGVGLFLDYGHLEPGFGDTFQAVRRHAFAGVLDTPGEADLTSHVDFCALSAIARGHGLSASTMDQGDFLLAMGLPERAGRLGAGRDAATQARLAGEVERLAGADAMGRLFKALAVAPPGVRLPAFAR